MSEISEFMKREPIACIATVDMEGKPHVVPVWFTYKNGKVYIQTDRNSVKVRNLKKNSNVAVAVYRGEEAVIIQGKGRDRIRISLFNSQIRCVIEVTPKKVLYW